MIFNIEIEDAGKRLDLFLLEKLKHQLHISRSNLANQIPDFVTINGETVRKGKVLKVGDKVEVLIEEMQGNIEIEEDNVEAVNGPLTIVEETSEYIVLNKQGGVAVHPGYKNENNTIANYLKAYLEGKGEYDNTIKRAGIVHRLDKPVSGLLICAKNRTIQLFLQKQFENHEVVKLYLAKIENKELNSVKELDQALTEFKHNEYSPTEDWELLEGKIQRDGSNRLRMKFGEHGKDSISYILPLENNEMLINIKTGRMHQIRATLKSKNLIIEGDQLYGSRNPKENIELKQIFLRLRISENVYREWSL